MTFLHTGTSTKREVFPLFFHIKIFLQLKKYQIPKIIANIRKNRYYINIYYYMYNPGSGSIMLPATAGWKEKRAGRWQMVVHCLIKVSDLFFNLISFLPDMN